MKIIRKNILWWITFLWTVIIWFSAYWWTNYTQTATSWQMFTSNMWNSMITQLNDVWTRTDWIYSSWWNIWIWTSTPNRKLQINWETQFQRYNFFDDTNWWDSRKWALWNWDWSFFIQDYDTAWNNFSVKFSIWNSTGNVWIWNSLASTRLQVWDWWDWLANWLTIHSNYPTIYMRDSDNRSAMIHLNNDTIHFLRWCDSWSNPNWWNNWCTPSWNNRWPLAMNISNNDSVFWGPLRSWSNYQESVVQVWNDSGIADSRSILRLSNNWSLWDWVIFKNWPSRTNDWWANTMTIRNDAWNLRLRARGWNINFEWYANIWYQVVTDSRVPWAWATSYSVFCPSWKYLLSSSVRTNWWWMEVAHDNSSVWVSVFSDRWQFNSQLWSWIITTLICANIR